MFVRRRFESDDEQWAPVSDLMAAVMLIFMLIAVILFVNFDLERRSNNERCEETLNMLKTEFAGDFANWGALLERDLTIRFTNQRVLFESNSSEVERTNVDDGGWFAAMLRDFFPRYMKIIGAVRNKFGEDDVLAIRIEGHTSSVFANPGVTTPYIRNMELSQDRARKILQYVTNPAKVPHSSNYNKTVRELVTANGLSSSRLICMADGREDEKASRRVEFKLLTDSCQKAGRYNEEAQMVSCLAEIAQ